MALEKKAVGINPLAQTHYTDHLSAVCVLMDIPLLFLDEKDLQLGLKHFPELNGIFEQFQELTPDYLISRYDVLFMSDLWDRETFHQKYGPLEKQYQKVLRHVHCPHGYSDKSYYLKKVAHEDIVLIYGPSMLDMLERHGLRQCLNQFVITGNYRYTYFKRHMEYYRTLVKREILDKFDKEQPVILYAPTWMDLVEGSTFFEASETLLSGLPKDFNMIVKLHPRLELDDIVSYYRIMGQFENQGNIIFIKDFPTYPLLKTADIYIGDTSSVGYDFLVFDRPMFFLNKYKIDSKTDPDLYLFRCGVEVFPEQYGEIYKIIERSLAQDKESFSQIRQEVYKYTFGEEKPFETIKEEIIKAYNS